MKNVFNQLQLLLFIISLSVIFTVTLLAEGTRELAPNANIVIDGNNTNDIAALHIDNAVFNNFASFGNSNVNSRLHVHIADPLTEGIMLGFSGGHTNQTGGNPPQVNFEYQILDPAGNIVFGPILVTNTNARINNWSEAFNGPMQLNGTSGYDAMEVTAADLTSAGWTTEGDYYIEFRNLMGGAFLIDYWDITVADFSSTTVEEKKGRVWSFNWAFFAINDFGFPERPFNGSFYVCAPDPQNLDAAFITEIDFNGSGFRPAAFNIAFNSFGTLNTSNIVADRRSQENVNSTTPEYAIFLNDPVDICETAESGEIEVLGITRCGIDDFCIKFIGTRSGQIDLLLDFDGNDQVFTPGTADVMITGSVSAGDVGQAVCLDWNGLDGLGNALPEDANTPIPISLSFAQGIYHFPIYDAELMTDGFDINTVRPAGPKPLLYYDDTEISVSSGSGEPNVQLMGCNLPCHSWTNYSNPGTVGFGNLNTINSWWFSQQTMNTMTFFLPGVFTCDIEGPQVACEDEEVDLGIIIDLTPDNAMPLTIESINWTGPGILGGNGTEVITINEDGSYNADLSFINELGDTCTSSCQFEYAQLPKSEETIDTLLAFGDSLVVNTEIYDVDGTYTQILTAANGCDSILTIIVEVEMPEIELRCEIFGPEFLCAGDTTTLTLDIIKDPIDAPDPEILSIGWFGPGVPIGASGQSVVAEQAGVYIAEYIWVNFTNDTLKGACEYTLEVMPEFEVTIDTLINSGDVVIFNGESFDSAGIFTQELSTTMGCDSIIIITIDVIDPTYTCLLTGTPEICEGEVSIIELEAVVDPIGAPAPIISEIVWSGPGVAANTTGTTIDATESGIYTAELSWFNNADSILSTSCIYSLTVNPTFETTIDTLIGEDEIIAISGQIITSPGQYILNFNAQNGCDSLLIINVIQESSVVYYDLDDCRSTDYSRFDPDYPSPVDCAFMTASNVFRVNPNVNSHSCTPGVNGGVGLCVSSEDDCDYNPDSEKAIIFELVVSPDEEEAVQITSLRFFERAPETFQWIVGTTGLNNYPTQYGLRVLKNNQEIFSSADNVTTTDWTAETFNFATLPDFKVQEQTIFRFELLGYCLIGNDSDVTAWDVDEISIQADCAEFVSNTIDIVGQVKTISNEPLENVQVDLKFGEFDFQKFVDQTNEAGQYAFQDVPRFQDYMVKPVSGDDYLRGVSTLDLIHIQRHILGLDRFEYAHQMIAADVNKSKSITAIDILQLRKLILGIYDRLPDNRSWRFMKSNQELHVSNPWAIQENVEFNNTEKDKSQGFVGIKIGDVNNDISLLPSSNVDSRSAKNSIDLMIESNDLRVGELSTVAIKIANENDIVGIQMSMALKGIDIINVESNFGLTDSHYKITPEHFVLSYTDVTGSQMNDEATIFLDVIPNVAINISDALELDKEILLPEIYKGKNLTVHPINLIFDSNDVDNFVGTNYPNPFVQNTTIEVMASENKEGVIKLYDFNGRMLMNRNIDLIKGINKIQINHTDLGLYSGIILYEITTDSGFTRGRMLRIEK